MVNDRTVILIAGDGGCGKDTVAEYIAKNSWLPYYHSTSYTAAIKMWEAQQTPIEYQTLEDLYNDRRNHREWWAKWIKDYNENAEGDRKSIALYLDCVNQHGNQILTGIRKKAEIEGMLKYLDLIIWVERAGNRRDITQEFGPEYAHMTIHNDYSQIKLFASCARIGRMFLRREAEPTTTPQT